MKRCKKCKCDVFTRSKEYVGLMECMDCGEVDNMEVYIPNIPKAKEEPTNVDRLINEWYRSWTRVTNQGAEYEWQRKYHRTGR